MSGQNGLFVYALVKLIVMSDNRWTERKSAIVSFAWKREDNKVEVKAPAPPVNKEKIYWGGKFD